MTIAAALARRLEGLVPIGLGPQGTTRLAWTPELAQAEAWFAAQAADVGLEVQRDPAGSLWACPPPPAPWWGVGSHLDSVRDGGRHDGALGVAAGFEIAARSEGLPLAVLAFTDEEGARFNTPTFGSRALVGRLDVADALARTDDEGVTLADAMAGAGVDPGGLAGAPAWLDRLRGFVELHIDQTRDLEVAGAPVGVVRALASRRRLRIDVEGHADHAGTTRGADRHDALAAAARVIVAAGELAAGELEMVATASRIVVEPNAFTTVPRHVRLWLDARAPSGDALDAWRRALDAHAAEVAAAGGVQVAILVEAGSAGVVFDGAVRDALAVAALRAGAGVADLLCYAGHDAGVIGERLPAGMLFVRNPTGVSHAPQEEVAVEDAAIGVQVMVDALRTLA